MCFSFCCCVLQFVTLNTEKLSDRQTGEVWTPNDDIVRYIYKTFGLRTSKHFEYFKGF